MERSGIDWGNSTGMFAGRFGARKSFITGSIVQLLSVGVMIIATVPWVFYISSFLSGLAVTIFSGAEEALIYESLKSSDEEDLMDEAMGRIQSATFATMMGTVLMGSYIAKDLQESQFQILLYSSLICPSIQLLLVCLIQEPHIEIHTKSIGNLLWQLKEGVSVIKRTPQLLWMFMNVTIVFIPTTAIFDNFDQLHGAGLPVKLLGIILATGLLVGG